MLRLTGSLVALATPFRDGRLDEEAYRALIAAQLAGGTSGLVPVGTTGEAVTMTAAERTRAVRLAVEVSNGRVPVVAGAGSSSTQTTIENIAQAREAGADAALVVTPYYNRPSQEGLVRHYEAVAAASTLPVIVYNVPSRTGVDIANVTLARLAKLPTIAGIKDATGDLGRPSLQRLDCGADWILLSGDDPSALGYMAHGGHGCISVTANVAPAECAAMFEAAMAGDFAGARALQDRLIRLHKALFVDASPAPAKFALARLGLCAEDCRLPITPCDPARHDEILAAMAAAGVAP